MRRFATPLIAALLVGCIKSDSVNPIGGASDVGAGPTGLAYTFAAAPHRLGAGLRNPSGYLPIPVTAGAATATEPRAAVAAAATDPASAGQWSSVQSWPIVAIHTTLLPNGKVLAWDTDTSGVGVQVYDPITNGFSAAPYSPANLFCAGHGVLPDGRVFVAGGTISDATGLHDATIFDPSTQTWSSGAKMQYGRYYPTVTKLGDGRMMVTSGETTCDLCNAPIPELYDASTNTWTSLSGANRDIPFYPHMLLLPDGRVMEASNYSQPVASLVLDLSTQTWSTVDPTILDGGSAAMYVPGKIIKSGLGRDADLSPANSVATTYVIDMTQPSPAWRQTASMAYPRNMHNLTLLPDGTVLATGGGLNSNRGDTASAVLQPELWSPATETWTVLASMQTPRLYHSTALLLPDGRVLVAGGGRASPEVDQLSAEIFSPPYLFKGSRPTVASAPTRMQYTNSFFVGTPDAARIASVSLLGLGSVTHAFNQAQRFVPIAFQQASGGLTITAPANGNVAPPGYYMLFLVDTNGVPSVAPIVRISSGPADSQAPTAPANLAATAASSVQINLSWTASTDDVGVASYFVERCAGSGCTNFQQIGTATTPSYADTGLTTGTSYSYQVRANDGANNLSGYSNVATATASGPPPSSGLVAAYAFGEGSGTTTADATGKGHTGTLLGGATFTASGKYGNGLSLNGSTAYVDLGNAADLQITGSMTWSAWVYATANPADDGQIVAKSNGAGWQFKTSPDTGPQTFGVGVSPNSSSLTQRYSNTARQLSTWYHVAGVYDAAAATLNIYVNGVLDNGTLRGTIPTSQYNNAGENVVIGRRTGGYYFPGTIDELRLYNRALSQAEIQTDMNTAIAPTPDTQPPSAPTQLNATTASGSQINLSWTASTDNVGVTGYQVEHCQGSGCTNFSATGPVVTGTSSSDTGLSAGTTYSYRVKATDAAGNWSPYSGIASATTPTPDTQPPTPPTGLTATAASPSQINLTWTASTDNVGVTGYLLERCSGSTCTNFIQIATPTATSYSDTGLAASTTYRYQVRATDAANNRSAYSSIASATTQGTLSGLVAAYAFGEGSGTTTADATGKGHTGTLLGGATFTASGKYGNGLSLNGSTAYVDLGNAADLQITGSMTWSAWVYASANPADDGQIVAKSNGAGWQFKTSPDTGPQTFGVGVSPNSSSLTQRYSKTVRQLGTWYYVAGVYNAATKGLDIYVNGVLDNGTLRGTIPTSQYNNAGEHVVIGRRTGGYYFPGTIDELRLYNRALSQAEIQADMATPIAH
ncbi:MAG: DUF1929 domain-containing protein [Chloroflexi bacterium]|nr:MAG: DUF1929 domain-containing protein [Chloroflexota bacterium]